MTTEVTISLITSGATVIVAIVAGYFALRTKRAEQATKDARKEKEKLKAELSCINILFQHDFIILLNKQVENLFRETKAERFLLLFAVNGKTDFNFVSVCYEKMKNERSRGAVYRYVRLGIDEHYRQMLKDVERENAIYLKVQEMPNSLLKSIYQSLIENVRYSVIKFIKRLNADDENDIVIYSSLATCQDEDFTDNERVIIKAIYDVIRSHANSIEFRTIQ